MKQYITVENNCPTHVPPNLLYYWERNDATGYKMICGKRLAVVVPAYNEETLISTVIRTMPEIVDRIVVVDDASSDRTADVVQTLVDANPRLVFLRHNSNQGVGGTIVTGYKHCRNEAFDVVAVMAGDSQMDPDDLPNVVTPVARGDVDYCKGNRLFTGEAYRKIPKVRYFGNAVLSLLTKVASSYWHVADSQTSYTAIALRMLQLINWDNTCKRYGCPNDYLVRLNIYNARVKDVPIRPVYGVGERSKIRLYSVIPRISWLLFRLFVKWMFQKVRHPGFPSIGAVLCHECFPARVGRSVRPVRHVHGFGSQQGFALN